MTLGKLAMKSILILAVLVAAPLLSVNAQETSPPPATQPTTAQRDAWTELNEAAGAYRDNHLDVAEQHARRALQLDPDNRTAPLFLAAIVHRQSKNAPDNIALANEAIGLYKSILQKDPKNEEAYGAIADLYGQLHNEKALRDWIMQRAIDGSVADDKRAEAYIILASKDGRCSHQITETNKTTIVDPISRKATVSFKKPKDEQDFQRVKLCVARGLEEIDIAINLDPTSERAWSFRASLLRDAAALAEMEGKLDEKARLDQQRKEAERRTTELLEQNKKPGPP